MSNIVPVGQPSSASLGSMQQTERTGPVQLEAAGRSVDRVELSSAAQLLSKIAELPDVRQDLVDRVQTEIELGIYESPEKFSTAIDAFIADMKASL